jgi:hypothetical protein
VTPIDCVILILVAIMCTWSVHSYIIAVSRKREARAMARKRERRIRLAQLWQTRDWRRIGSCLVIHIDPVTLMPVQK